MKILQVVYAFYSESGNSRVAYNISKNLVIKGYDVTTFTTNVLSGEKLFIPKKGVYKIDGIKVHYYSNFIYKPHLPIPISYSGSLVKSIKENLSKYDIVHLHEYRFYTNPIVHFFAKKYSIPYVLQAHGSLPRIMNKQKW